MYISVVIPCRNAENYLAQTLGSLMDQTLPPEEVLVVDDGSADGSVRIARLFESASEGRVRVYARRSGSAAKTRAIGADIARGDLLMFLDADDVLDPEVLEGLSSALREEPAGVAVSPWERLEFQKGAWVRKPPSCRPWRDQYDALGNWLLGWYHPTSTVLWTRRAFAGSGGWDPACGVNDDGDLMTRALLNGTPLVHARKGTCFYRRLPRDQTSLSGKRTTNRGLESRLYIMEKICFQLERRKRIDSYRVPVGEALKRLRADIDGNGEELTRRIEACLRACGPSLPQRAAEGNRYLWGEGRRFVRKVRKSFGAGNRLYGKQVLYGIGRAKQVLSSDSANAFLIRQTAPPPPRRPSVSVVIPTYNRETTLKRAVGSVLAQTFPDLELLVIDDGSTDDTASLMRKIADPRVRYMPQDVNRGVAAARNVGLREVRGDFIAFLDSDDEWMPEKLERQLDLFERLPEKVGLVYAGVEAVTENGNRTRQMPSDRGDVYRKLLLRNIITGGGSTAVIRRNVVATVGFFDESLPAIEDYEYWLRLSRFFKVDFVPEVLMCYHTPPLLRRKSMDHKDNIDAREEFYRRYGHEMRRAGVAHLFLLDSAGRYLVPSLRDRAGARKLALNAALQRPLSHASLYFMLYTFVPSALLVRLRNWRYQRQG